MKEYDANHLNLQINLILSNFELYKPYAIDRIYNFRSKYK